MTIDEMLDHAAGVLVDAGIRNARVVAVSLVAHVLALNRGGAQA